MDEFEIINAEGIEFDTNQKGVNKIYFGDKVEASLTDEEVEQLYNQIKKRFIE